MYNSRSVVDRQVIAVVREYEALSKKRFTIIKLNQPIQRGWRRSYVLSEQAGTRPDREMLEAILAVIGTAVVHHRRDFLRRPGRRRKFVEIKQPLDSIPIHEWERKHYPTKWFPYFRRELVLEMNRHWQLRWVFTRPELFELKVERNWLWYFREVDPAIETRLSELDRWLESHDGWPRYGWLTGRRQRYRWREEPSAKQKNLRYEHQCEIDRASQSFPEFDPDPFAERARISRWPFIFPGVAQRRGNEFRPRPVRVQVLPSGPFFAPVAQCRGSGLKLRQVSVRVRPGARLTNAHVVQQQRHPPQKRTSAGATPAVGTNGT